MESGHRNLTVGAILSALVNRAIEDDVPRALAENIAGVTLRQLGVDSWRVASAREACRIEAYYSEVVRRRTMRGAAGPRAVSRVVAAAVVADLRQTGRDGGAIFDHLCRGWSERIPADVLEEYRVRLCG